MLTDLLIADESEAKVISESGYPLEQWKGIDAKGQSQITLGTLLCLLTQESYRNEVIDEFVLLAEVSIDGPWVFKLPDRLVWGLSQVDNENLPAIARQWSQTDEMLTAGFDRAKELLAEIAQLSNEATSQQKKLLLWICL